MAQSTKTTQKPQTRNVVNPEEMAANGEVMPDVDMVSTAPDDWEFETVIEESPTHVIFDTPGDVFVGQFVERITITPENPPGIDPDSKLYKSPFDLFTFRGRDGVLYAINPSGKLDKAMDVVKPGDWTRITLVKHIPSSKGNDFKDFRVEVRKAGTPRTV